VKNIKVSREIYVRVKTWIKLR